MRGRNSRLLSARACEVRDASFVPSREGHTTCSSICRSRKQRGTYVVTAEDRAAIDRVLADDSDLPPRLTPQQTRAHVLATARRHE